MSATTGKLNMVTMNAAFNEVRDQVAEHERQTALRITNLEADVENLLALVRSQEVMIQGLLEDTEKLNKFRDFMRERMAAANPSKAQQKPPFEPTNKPQAAAKPSAAARPAIRPIQRLPQQNANALTSMAQYAQYKERVKEIALKTKKSVDVIGYATAQHLPFESLMASLKK